MGRCSPCHMSGGTSGSSTKSSLFARSVILFLSAVRLPSGAGLVFFPSVTMLAMSTVFALDGSTSNTFEDLENNQHNMKSTFFAWQSSCQRLSACHNFVAHCGSFDRENSGNVPHFLRNCRCLLEWRRWIDTTVHLRFPENCNVSDTTVHGTILAEQGAFAACGLLFKYETSSGEGLLLSDCRPVRNRRRECVLPFCCFGNC